MWRIKNTVSVHLGDAFAIWKDELYSCSFNNFGIEVSKKHGKPELVFKIGSNFTSVLYVHNDELWVGDSSDILVFNLA